MHELFQSQETSSLLLLSLPTTGQMGVTSGVWFRTGAASQEVLGLNLALPAPIFLSGA